MGNDSSNPNNELKKQRKNKIFKKRSNTVYEANNNTADFIISEKNNNKVLKIDININNNINESKFGKEDNQPHNDNNNNENDQTNKNKKIITNSGNQTNININNINISYITNIIINNKEEEEDNYEKNLKRRSMTRARTYANIIKGRNIEKIPSDSQIFEKINIFNSILIIMNNISFINNYFSNPIVNNIIDKCQIHNKPYCLSHILYYMHKHLWNLEGKNKVSDNHLFTEYKNFIDYYSKNNLKESNEDKYCKDSKNVGEILKYIYSKINAELSFEKEKKFKNLINENLPIFSKYFIEFCENNCSIISDHFIGHYAFERVCNNCFNRIIYNYGIFYYINFNLKDINNNNYMYNNCDNSINFNNMNNNYYLNNNMCNVMNLNNMNNCYMTNSNNSMNINNINNINYMYYTQNINLDYCFTKLFPRIKMNNGIFCNFCKSFSNQSEITHILSLSNILTIELSNSENFNIFLEDELDLKKYTKNYPEKSEGIYTLISVLCRISNTDKYICYSINPYSGLWYSYNDKEINEVKTMDINAIPLIVIYQTKNSIKKYTNIKRDNEETIRVEVKFTNATTPKIFLAKKNNTIKNLIEQMYTYFDDVENIAGFLINGEVAKTDQLLSEFKTKNNNLVFTVIVN